MAKMKTHSGCAKRFSVTKSGKIKMTHMNRRHILTKKSPKRKRILRTSCYMSMANARSIRKLIPYM